MEAENEPDQIKFLGTAGSRIVVASQQRSSGGLYIRFRGVGVLVDPGPGTLIRCIESGIRVPDLDGIILTHSHIDHSNDVNIIIDAMTSGGWTKKGVLFAPRDCLEGENTVVLNYLRPFLRSINIIEPGGEYEISGMKFSTPIEHRHPVETYGLKFDFDNLKVGIIVDTNFFPGLIESYQDVDILILNVTIKEAVENLGVMHLCVEDAGRLISNIKPKKAILTHFGSRILEEGVEDIAQELSEQNGIEVISATDQMVLDI